MKLYIAGGCNEHGRNCFYIEGKERSLILDCGLMADKDDIYPHLSQEQIKKAGYLFLSHSHQDHSGAIPWLYENGFTGKTVATRETFDELKFRVDDPVYIEDISSSRKAMLDGISIEWGRSGHAVGSIWYYFSFESKMILYSGDYIEDTQVYICDKIRGREADIAIVDCAYGKDETLYCEYTSKLVARVNKLLEKTDTIVFPTPKYGRSIELAALFSNQIDDVSINGDEHFENEIIKIPMESFWYKKGTALDINKSIKNKKKLIFISDPQLRDIKSQESIDSLLANGARAIMTGTVDDNSYSQHLIDEGKMEYLRYPVHTNYRGLSLLSQKNGFKKLVAFHSKEFSYPRDIEF